MEKQEQSCLLFEKASNFSFTLNHEQQAVMISNDYANGPLLLSQDENTNFNNIQHYETSGFQSNRS